MRDWPDRTRTWPSGGRLPGISTTASRSWLRTAWSLKSNLGIHRKGYSPWSRPKDATRRLDECDLDGCRFLHRFEEVANLLVVSHLRPPKVALSSAADPSPGLVRSPPLPKNWRGSSSDSEV